MIDAERLGSSHRPRKRDVVRQACDPCRRRKAKCETQEVRDADVDGLEDNHRTPCCRRCIRLSLDCTYCMPFGVRGPRVNSRSLQSAFASTPPLTETSAPTSLSPLPFSDLGSTVNPSDATSPGLQPYLSHNESARLPSKIPQWPVSPQTSLITPSLVACHKKSTFGDDLCSRDLLKTILLDYLEYLYPLIPVVHRPSFRRDLYADRDLHDEDFFGLVLGLCAITVGTMPSRFKAYSTCATPLRFRTRTEMIRFCCDRIHSLRGPRYFETINLQKWAASYLMGIALFQIGEHNQARMIEVESMQLARLLGLHLMAEYEGLNCIETQLRKKAFWMMFYGYVHDQYQNLRKERLTYLDANILACIDLERLIPLEVDDEHIYEHTILPQPPGSLSVVAGFNAPSRVFWTAIQSTKWKHQECYCDRIRQPAAQFKHLTSRIQDLNYMLDGLPPQLRQWQSVDNDVTLYSADPDKCQLLKAQFATMRANLHVTHLWLQSIISDQMDAILLDEKNREKLGSSAPSQETSWVAREHICRQLLHVLYAIPDQYLEPNGHYLTYKVRDVAVGLLTCPFGPHTEAASRASEYLQDFAKKLCSLDGSEIPNTTSLQSWVDTDRSYLQRTH